MMTPTLLVLSLIVNVCTIWGLVRAAKIIFTFEDNINESLDALDKSYQGLSKIANTPVLFDDPQIKQAIKELNAAKNAVLLVANKLTSNSKQSSE